MDKSEIGRNSRQAGKRFENATQKDLEEKGYIVMRFMKKIENGKLIDSRAKFFMGRLLSYQTGFPDFLCIIGTEKKKIVLVECKLRGSLSNDEREQVKFLRNYYGFTIWVASKDGDKIRYKQAVANA